MNYALWGLFGPVSWPFWLMLVALVALWRRRQTFAKISLSAALCLFIVFALLPTGAMLLVALEEKYPRPALMPKVERILVLAGGEDIFSAARTGRVEFGDHGDRAVAAGLLAKRHPDTHLYIVGYGQSDRHPASDTAITARYWRGIGVAPDRITEIGRTADTCANLAGYARAAPTGSVLLVTSAFHMPRSMACAAAAGVNAIPYPVDYQVGDDLPWAPNVDRNLSLTDLALHEWTGISWYRLRGRID